MKNIIKYILTIFVILISMIYFNCNNSSYNNKENNQEIKNNNLSGTLTINIKTNNIKRTIYPDFNIVDHYIVEGQGPDGLSFYKNNANNTVIINNLKVGLWTIHVSGVTIDNKYVTYGVKNITINEGDNNLTVNVTYLQNSKGKVDLTLDWTLANVNVDSVLLKINEDDNINLTINNKKVNFKADLTSDFYLFRFYLKNNNKIIGSYTDVVHIYDNLVTSSIKIFNTNDFNKPPVAPDSLMTNEGTGKIILSWSNPDPNIAEGYVIERSTTSGSGFSPIGNTDNFPVPPSYTMFIDNTVDSGTQYYYRIKAINNYGESYSNEAQGKFDLPEVLSITPSNNSQNVEISTNIIIKFNQSLNSAVKGSISFINPSITFNNSNCNITFSTTNVINDTVIFDLNNNLIKDTTYDNITISGFKDINNNLMNVYTNPAYYFKTTKRILIAYYPFNGNANDESGNRLNPVSFNSEYTIDRFNIYNKACIFDGDDDYISYNDNDEFDLTSDFTISAWIYINNFVELGGIISKYHSIAAKGFTFRLGWTSPYSSLSLNGAETLTDILSLNTWTHVLVTCDGEYASFYVNGIFISTNFIDEVLQDNDNQVIIGCDFKNGGARYFDGKIDDVRIYNYQLSASEITALYNSEKPPVNIALNKTVYFSSQYTNPPDSEHYPAGFAVDGNPDDTRWSSKDNTGTGSNPKTFNTPQWITVDLGQNYNITQIILKFEAGSSDYDVLYSLDNNNWSNILTNQNTQNFENKTIDSGLPSSARYIKALFRTTYGTDGVSLWEFEIYGN